MRVESEERIIAIFERRFAEGTIPRELADRCIAHVRENADRARRTCAKCFRLDCGDTCAAVEYLLRFDTWGAYDAGEKRHPSTFIAESYPSGVVTSWEGHPIADCVLVWLRFPEEPTIAPFPSFLTMLDRREP